MMKLRQSATPEKVTVIINQTGNAYEAGLLEAWNPIKAYWEEPSEENRKNLRMLLAFETTCSQYYARHSDISPQQNQL